MLGIDNLDRPALAAVVYLNAPDADRVRGEQRMVSVDQRTGAILGERLRYAGFLGTCADLHVYLLGGETGYVVNGVGACAFLLLCLTGWLLWWPGARSVGRGLRIHWGARWKRLNWDLHAVSGFWSNPLLLAVIATGILFVFPRPVLVVLSTLTGGRTKTYAYAVHFGTFAGIGSRIAWVLLGLMPAALWTTGLLLWWNRGLRRLRDSIAMRKAGA